MRCAAIVLAALALTGCSVFAPRLLTPQLSIVAVEPLKGNFWEQRLRVHIRVDNPNNRALPVAALSYSIQVAGQELAHGAANDSFIVPALGDTEFATDVSANVAGAILALLAHGQGADEIAYRIEGKVTLAQGIVRTIPFDHQGSFKLQ